jgi:peptidyl-prolyl cis-trans isomerase D
MLTTMRERTKAIMLILSVAFVGWLVFDVGMGVSGRGQYQAGQNAGTVNGKPVGYQDWLEASRVAFEQWRQQNPGVNQSREEQQQVENAAFEKLVQDGLVRNAWQRRGVTVSDREIRDAVQNSPPPEVQNAPDFQTDGRFDLTKWRRYLASSAIRTEDLVALEARYRDELPRVKLIRQITSDVYVSDPELWQTFKDARDSVTVRALVVRPEEAVSAASVRVTPQDLEAYYRTHQAGLAVPARAYLSFVAVSKIPQRIDSILGVARARAVRDTILRGADFAEVARRESADSATRTQGGELGTFGRFQMAPAFERAAFSLPIGQVSEPVVTPFGAHLIKVERRTKDSVTARHILIPLTRSGARLDTLEARADSLDRLGAEQTGPGALDSVARVMDLGINAAPPVMPNRPLLLGRFTVPDVSVWAFEVRPGETSPVIENAGAYYVFRLDSVQPAGLPPLPQVEAQVQAAVLTEKKRAAAEAIARDAERRLRTGQSLDQVAQALRLPVETIGPFARTSSVRILGQATAAVGSAFRLRVGERSGLLASPEAFFFIEPSRLVRADSAEWVKQREQQRVEVLRAARSLRVRFFLIGLRDAAKVENGLAELRRRPAAADTAR